MDSDFEKRFPLTTMLLRVVEKLSEDGMFDLMNSLSDDALIQLTGEMIVLQHLLDVIDLLTPEQIKALSMMANYRNN